MRADFDAIVIGGGFFGCAIGLSLAEGLDRVRVLERRNGLLERASYVNQARVHTGYHYPRSLQTAASSHANLKLFEQVYSECVDSTFTALYAIARGGSKVNRAYFERFCRRLGLPVKAAPKRLRKLFSERLIEDVFECQEYAFDARALRDLMVPRLTRAGVDVTTRTEVTSVQNDGPERLSVHTRGPEGERTLSARWVFNTTYANLNRLAGMDPEGAVGLRHQVTEVCLVQPPPELAPLGITVMDGPFFSLMPFPARGLHSLTHVRYTPHFTWSESDDPRRQPDEMLARHAKHTRFEWMRRDAARYLPVAADVEHRDQLFEIKTTLVNTAVDDARPIAFHRDRSLPRLISVLGGKIDNIFDVLKVIRTTLRLDE